MNQNSKRIQLFDLILSNVEALAIYEPGQERCDYAPYSTCIYNINGRSYSYPDMRNKLPY